MADNKKSDDTVIELGEMRGAARSPAHAPRAPAPSGPAMPTGAVANNPVVPVLSYCASSIMMTVTNKFVLSGDFNLNFFLLCVQVGLKIGKWEQSKNTDCSLRSLLCVSWPFKVVRLLE